MQHIRKLVLIFSAVIFVVITVLGMGLIFAVRNVNITLLSYTCEADSNEAKAEISEIKQKVLRKFQGNFMSFVTEEGVSEVLNGDKYALEKFEKVYPCTLEFTVKERRETYAKSNEEGCFLLFDDKGIYIKSSEENINVIDGASNVLLEGVSDSSEIISLAEAGEIFSVRFGAMRSVTEKIILAKAQSSLEKDKVTFILRCGVRIEIRDYKNMTAGKIDAAYRKYENLTGEQKLQGIIYCTVTLDGNFVATYSLAP